MTKEEAEAKAKDWEENHGLKTEVGYDEDVDSWYVAVCYEL